MVFITRRWAKNHRYGPYYYLGSYENGRIKWKYLGKLDNLSSDKLKILEEVRTKYQDKVRIVDQIMGRNRRV